ncbi:glycoside hydrolase family 9 protein [Hyunsoonleella sp. 2307UL5-6]|uniref:glycoside hydrolase family 9 protein n=1 Tax=Hyunsoonleella sp. 2307UL5-6 TaxID=3384768 RepID=UPI0039BD1FA2
MKLKLSITLVLFNVLICVSQTIDIRYNQLGYFNNRSKIISLTSGDNFSPQSFNVLDANDAIVLSGTSKLATYWADAQVYVSQADISAINTAGVYTFKSANKEVSFTVGTDIYKSISSASLKYYYYSRASTAIPKKYGGVYARPMGHPDTNARVHSSAASASRPVNTVISSPKGWYDAGDYNKYIVNSGISTYTLLAAFEHFDTYYKSKTLNIPETGGDVPDVLDEIKWNLDWMLTMQEPSDGGVYHKLTGLNFSNKIMPENYKSQRYVVGKSTAAALNFAAVMAVASRIYANYETALPEYSTTLLEAAETAYTWAKANPKVYFTNPKDVTTGEYGDNNVADEFEWAAVELFITTKKTEYNKAIKVSNIDNKVPGWRYTDGLALISMLYHKTLFPSNTITSAKNSFLSTADKIKHQVEHSAMHISMGIDDKDYTWGSNAVAANQILLLIRAYEFTKTNAYLDAAYTAMDYLLGRNGTGFCYVTGFGDMPTTYPHHRISEEDGIEAPIPGMLSGGPNPARQDKCSGYLNTSKAGSYVDAWCSFASNEVAINWNAPLAYTLNALNFYGNTAP